MHLLKCHIENFGKFSKFDYVFDKGLNIINEENGWGKTTLSAFIKAMFYGMSGGARKSLEENDRKMYFPSLNAKYGGYVEFENENKTYRLERYFGKTESGDVCLLTDLSTGQSFPEPNKKWGERLFGVNADVFIRTLFLSQKDIDISENSVIADKMGVIDPNASDENFEKAIDLLEKKRRELLYKTQKGGKIFDKKRQLLDLGDKIEACQTASKGVELIDGQIKTVSNEIAELEKSISNCVGQSKKAREHGATIERLKTYNDKLAQKEELQTSLDKNLTIINGSEMTIGDVKKSLTETAVLSQMQKENAQTTERIKELEAEKQKILSDYDVAPTISDYQELLIISHDLATVEVVDVQNSEVQNKKIKSLPIIPLCTLFALVLIAGIALCIVSPLFGVLTAIIGFVGLVVIFVLFVLKQLKINANKLNEFSSGKALDAELNQIKRNKIEAQILLLKGRLGLYGYQFDELISKVKKDVHQIGSIDVEISQLKRNFDAKLIDINAGQKVIEDNLSVFNLPKEFADKNNSEKLNKILEIMLDINAVEDKISAVNTELNALKEKGIVLSDDVKNYNVEELDKTEIELNNRLKEANVRKQTLLANRRNMYIQQEKVEEYLQEKETLLEEIAELQRQVVLLDKTVDYLSSARKTMIEKYLAPLTDNLYGYLSKLSKTGHNVVITSEYQILVEIDGELRSIEHCSKGWKNLYLLALRFAFIDEIFSKNNDNSPFIILDDPFVNYDGAHLKNALSALKEFSSEKQVIYFTCHDSRATL